MRASCPLFSLLYGFAIATAIACQGGNFLQASEPPPKIVERHYIHKYGLSMPRTEWLERGGHGQVVTCYSNGVKVTRQYQDGLLDGYCAISHPHIEEAAKREFYRAGKLIEESFYQPSGALKEQYRWPEEGIEELSSWYETGEPKSEELWIQGKLAMGRYFDEKGHEEASVEDGEGRRIRRDPYGQLQAKDSFSDGQLVAFTSYHPNGAPKEAISLLQGKRHGLRALYLPDGQPLLEEEWLEGAQHGMTKEYRNGEVAALIPYQKGTKEGVEERYVAGELVEKRSWKQGKRHGPTQKKAGEALLTEWYFQDRLVTKEQFDGMGYYTPHQRTSHPSPAAISKDS